MKRKILILSAAGVVFLGALFLVLYPMISTRYNEAHQSELHTQYSEQLAQVDTSAMDEALELAESYNDTLRDALQGLEPFSAEAIAAASSGYRELLDMTGSGTMGYIEIPIIGVELPIYHGTGAETLSSGVGHLLGTSLPIGGESSHAALSAHSGMASQRMFSDLDQLNIGDIFYVRVLGETLAYQVDQVKTVLPYEVEDLTIIEGEDLCTLITCTPYGINSHRLLVRGTRIPYEQAEESVTQRLESGDLPTSTWEQKYWQGIFFGLGLTAALVCCGGAGLYFYRKSKERKLNSDEKEP